MANLRQIKTKWVFVPNVTEGTGNRESALGFCHSDNSAHNFSQYQHVRSLAVKLLGLALAHNFGERAQVATGRQ